MTNPKIGASDQLKDPNHEIPLGPRIALVIQHVLAMFASNITPSIIIAGAAGFAFGGEDMVYFVQMAMLFAGVATLFQTIGFGPIGARLPVMQGTGFAFVPMIIGIVKTSAIEPVGDISGIAKGGANREAMDKELSGGTCADGFGNFIAGLFGGLTNMSFSQNVGLISITGVMSRSAVTLGALFLVACGLIPKVGAVVAAMPIWVGLGIQAVPTSMQNLPDSFEMLMVSGLLPAAAISVILNLLIPKDID